MPSDKSTKLGWESGLNQETPEDNCKKALGYTVTTHVL